MDKQQEYKYILEFIESSDDLDQIIVMQQLRCLWTAFCIHHGINGVTYEYDAKIDWMWEAMQENESAPYSSLEHERFYRAMSNYLV